MERRLYTDSRIGSGWCRCAAVSINGDAVSWTLKAGGEYDFLSAYSHRTHQELIEADSDNGLVAFMRRWGPLRKLKDGNDSVSWYRCKRDSLTATARLLDSIEQRADQRPALLALLNCGDEAPQLFFRFYRRELRIPGDPDAGIDGELKKWCESSSAAEVERVCLKLVEEIPMTCVPRFTVKKQGRRNVVQAGLFVNNLAEAVKWMLWQDVFQMAPIRFCPECHSLIEQSDKRKRKFCQNNSCAKKVADRKYAAKKRKEKKELKIKKVKL
jgi:hypothetical protein